MSILYRDLAVTEWQSMKYYSKEMLELGRRMFPLLALALEMDENFFDDKVSGFHGGSGDVSV
jgi:isopenicillin N synthase-like dioxygenase